MADFVVTVDRFAYLDKDGNRSSASRGEKVTLTDDAAKRGKALGAIATPGSREAKEAAVAAAGPVAGAAREEELRKMSLDDLREYASNAGVEDADQMYEDALVAAIRGRGAIQPLS